MKLTKSVLCRLFSCVLMLTFVMTVFPFSAFALENGVGLQVRNYLVDENGDFIERLKTLNNLKYDHEQSFTKWKLEDDTIDLWVYSSEMEDAGQIDGSVVPYTYDDLGNKYELTQINACLFRERSILVRLYNSLSSSFDQFWDVIPKIAESNHPETSFDSRCGTNALRFSSQ